MSAGGTSDSATRAPDASTVRVFMLGVFRVALGGRILDDDAWRRRKPRQLLKYLCAHPGHRATREELVELLWPESDPEAASTNLRTTLHALRQTLDALGVGVADRMLAVDRATVGLRAAANIWIDAEQFEELVRRAQSAADPADLLKQADALYTGDFLADDTYESWANERRDVLKQTWTELQFNLARLSDQNGYVAAMERLVRLDPCNERAAQELMRALIDQGRRRDALRVYQRVEQALRDELDVEPDQSLIALRERAQSTEPAVPEPRTASFRPAYPLPTTTRLVGRAAELHRLERLLRQGRDAGAMAIISGPAGMGKSALLPELMRQAQSAGVLCLAGGCYEAHAIVPFGPFHDALADYLLAQPPQQVRAEIGSTAEDLSTLIPELRHHLDLVQPEMLSPDHERMRQFGAVLSCLRALCAKQPVLLCLEDLHAADAATMHLLHYLARQTRRLPLTIIATLRSEEAQLAAPLAEVLAAILQERLAERVLVGPLDPAGTESLLETLLEGRPSRMLVQWLHRTAEGNPLFVQQLAFALKEKGQLASIDGEWRSLVDPDQSLPHIIRDVIRQRLEHLRTQTRETLSMGAVLGQSFEYPTLLAALDSDDEASVLGSLEEGLNAHLLQETPTGYAFSHTLLHQAMYWSISSPRRMRLHARAGETVEKLAGVRRNDLCSELGRHFARGGRSRELRAKALQYGLEAGRRAAALSAYREALQQYAELWPLVEVDSEVDPSMQLAVLEGRARAELQLAMWNECIRTYTLITQLTDDPLARARAMRAIAYALHHTDRAAEAPDQIARGLAELEALGDGPAVSATRLELRLEQALHLFLEGHYRAQAALAEQMVHEAIMLNEPTSMSVAFTASGIAHMGLGQFDHALHEFQQARSYSEVAQDKIRIAIAQENLGLLQMRMGDLETSRDHFEAALHLYRETSALQVEERPGSRAVNTLQGLARVSLAQERIEEAQRQAEMAASLARDASDRWAAECQFVLGSIHARLFEWDQAEACFSASLAIRERVGHAAGIVESLVALGGSCEARHDWERARERYEESVEVAARMDPSPSAVSAWRHLGLLLLRHFDAERGAALIRSALALAEEMPRSVEYAQTRAALEH